MRVNQIIDALDFGDGVSNDVINIDKLLNSMNYETKIYSLYVNDKVKKLRRDFTCIEDDENNINLFHFSGKSDLLDKVLELKGKNILVYHNITPHKFFKNLNNDTYNNCLEGREQLKSKIKFFDGYIAVSDFNKEELISLGAKSVEVFPIVIDYEKMNKINFDKSVIRNFDDINVFLSVARIAPNKKHEDMIRIFDYYYKNINKNAAFICVGDFNDNRDYYLHLNNLLSTLECRYNVIFTGKVSDEKLNAYYKTAKIFLSMSEHEGFCLPLLESMHMKIPVIAYDSGAVSQTMGNAGVLVFKKEYKQIAETIDVILKNNIIRKKIINKQSEWVENFSEKKMKEKLQLIMNKLED